MSIPVFHSTCYKWSKIINRITTILTAPYNQHSTRLEVAVWGSWAEFPATAVGWEGAPHHAAQLALTHSGRLARSRQTLGERGRGGGGQRTVTTRLPGRWQPQLSTVKTQHCEHGTGVRRAARRRRCRDRAPLGGATIAVARLIPAEQYQHVANVFGPGSGEERRSHTTDRISFQSKTGDGIVGR